MNPVVDGVPAVPGPGRAFAAGRRCRCRFPSGATTWEASLIRFCCRSAAVLARRAARRRRGHLRIADERQLKERYFGDSVFLVSAARTGWPAR